MAPTSNTTHPIRSRRLALLLATALLVGTTVITAPQANAALGAVGPVEPSHGFPTWYEDTEGLRLELCLEQNGLCLTEEDDPGQPISFPDNFGGEAFWWAAEAAMEEGNVTAQLVLAMEAAFFNEDPIDGDQMTFGRIRIRVTGLTAGQTYTVTHPYGTDEFVATADTRNINVTDDIGCGAAPCDFEDALDSNIGPFLVWANLAAAPPGYIGNPNILSRVTGSPHTDPETLAPANLFRVTGPGLDMQTDLFSVMGKIDEGVRPPSAPREVAATRAGPGAADVSWQIPVSSGQLDILDYQVTATPQGGGTPVDVTVPAATTATVPGLVNGTTYTFAVTARNAEGSGPAGVSAPLRIGAAPLAPAEVTATEADGQVTVSWTPSDAQGFPITGYRVVSTPDAVDGTVTGTTATFSGLVGGQAYTFAVTATNELGTSPATISNAVTFVTPPGAPQGLAATAINGGARLAWSAPASDGGAAVTGYEIARSGAAPIVLDADTTSHEVRELANDTTYTFEVRARNERGLGAAAAVTVTPTEFASACPTGSVEPAGFGDVTPGNTHRRAIDCVSWWDIARGFDAATFGPARTVNRAQMASFIARMIDNTTGNLPAAGNRFDDIGPSVHRANIERLAAAGIAQGRGARTFDPNGNVTRAQMASFLIRGYEYAASTALERGSDAFVDDDGSVHEENIDKAANAGIARGVNEGVFAPDRSVRRDQMASFIARTVNLLVEDGHGSPPTP